MTTELVFLLLVTASSVRAFRLQSAGCQLGVNADLPNPEPLLIQIGGAFNVKGFLQPDDRGVIYLTSGDKILLACPGIDNYLATFSETITEATATCATGTTFQVNGDNHDITNLECSFRPSHHAIASGEKCLGNYTEILIGFNVSRGFYKTVDVCFDEELLRPLYSHTTVVSGIAGHETGVERPDFKAAGFYGTVSPDHQYQRDVEIETIGELLGSEDLGKKYISTSTFYFLSRGHLSPKSDFVFGNEHRASFYYVNSAPQWLTFNSGNWAVLEQNVRQLATDKGVDLEVYTGTHGIAMLPDINGNDTPLYLHVDKVMPVPQFFWKVVYLPQAKAATALIGINNPYIKLADHPELMLCPNVCDEITWITWKATSVKRGEGYCCELATFRKAIPSIPELSVNQLLT